MAKKELTVELAVLADYVMHSEDKKLSIIGIFDKIFVTNLPASHPQMTYVVTLAGAEPFSQEKFAIRVVSPSQKDIIKGETAVHFGDNGKANIISNFSGVLVEETGTYEIFLERLGKKLGICSLDVIRMKRPEEGEVVRG